MPGGGVAIEEIDGRQCGDAANLRRKITATRAEGVRNAAPRVGDEAGDLLDAGAGRADDADVATRNGIGERQRHAGDDGRAAVGPHDNQPEIAGLALEGYLLLQRYVVGEDHDVEAATQRFSRLGGGEIAGHRDERQIGVRHLLHGAP